MKQDQENIVFDLIEGMRVLPTDSHHLPRQQDGWPWDEPANDRRGGRPAGAGLVPGRRSQQHLCFDPGTQLTVPIKGLLLREEQRGQRNWMKTKTPWWQALKKEAKNQLKSSNIWNSSLETECTVSRRGHCAVRVLITLFLKPPWWTVRKEMETSCSRTVVTKCLWWLSSALPTPSPLKDHTSTSYIYVCILSFSITLLLSLWHLTLEQTGALYLQSLITHCRDLEF